MSIVLKTILVVTGVCAFLHMGTLLSGCDQKEVAPLSIQETLGAVFIRGHEGPAAWNVYRLANKDAKAAVWKVLRNKRLVQYHYQALFILGYIGDNNDAAELEKLIRSRFQDVLPAEEQPVLAASFTSLGLMSRRNVKKADDILEKMMDVDYWKPRRFWWRAKTAVLELPPEYETLVHVVRGYATSEEADLDEKIAGILKDINDPMIRQEMEFRISPKTMRSLARQVTRAERKSIDLELRRALPGLFNGDLENPGPSYE